MIVYGQALVRPGEFLRTNLRHKDVSEGSKHYVVAERVILGYKVKFYNDGYREIIGLNISDDDIYNSQILRFTHASLLLGESVGNKNTCWVDATYYVVEVWLYGKQINQISDLEGLF